MRKTLHDQAVTFGRYHIGTAPTDLAVQLYTAAMQGKAVPKNEQRLFNLALRHPTLIPYIDAGLVFTNPHAELRRRLFVMFAILETMPEYTALFLSKQREPLYLLFVLCVGVRAVFRTVIGVVITGVFRSARA